MIILGIESSCDETAASVIKITDGNFEILSSTVLSQIDTHKKYGGVVPEIAARKHVKNILPVIDQTLIKAKISPNKIDRIAVTTGPGLITSLIVGTETAKNLAYTWKKPIVGVNHLKAHLYANFLDNQKISWPAISLIVSGGHTEIILMTSDSKFKKIGQTLDDAAGEAFDKVAKLLGLSYPGGPEISKLAKEGDSQSVKLPRPMINSKDYNFSFSGLKTAVLYANQKIKNQTKKTKADMAASFEQAVVEVLTSKTIKAAKEYKAKTIMLSGGVAANTLLRQTLQEEAKKLGVDFIMPEINLCTDNATMIAAAGYFSKPEDINKIKVNPNLEI